MLRTCAHVAAPHLFSPEALPPHPRAPSFPHLLYSVHSPSPARHYIFSLLPLCLSPLTRMQAPWGQGFLSVWVTSACPAPGMGAGTHCTVNVMYWLNEGTRWGLWERKHLPAASSLPLCSGARMSAQNSSSHSANGMEASFGLELPPGKAGWKRERNQNPKDSNPKAGPVSRSPSYLSQQMPYGWSHFELGFPSFLAGSIPTDHLHLEIWKDGFTKTQVKGKCVWKDRN